MLPGRERLQKLIGQTEKLFLTTFKNNGLAANSSSTLTLSSTKIM